MRVPIRVESEMPSSIGGHLQIMESDEAIGGEMNLPRLEEPRLFAVGVEVGAFCGQKEAEHQLWH